jgi:streptomycin 6-kinase
MSWKAVATEYLLSPTHKGSYSWRDRAIGIANELETEWHLNLEQVLSGGLNGLVIKGNSPVHGQVVLKLGAERQLIESEITALECWQGSAPKVLSSNLDLGAMLISYIDGRAWKPRESGIKDGINVGKLLLNISCSPPSRLPSLSDRIELARQWGQTRYQSIESERETANRCFALLRSLASCPSDITLLHGDLQSKNMIESKTGNIFLIDPLACRGDIAFDIAFWSLSCLDIIEERALAAAKEAGVDGQRVLRWLEPLAILFSRPSVPPSDLKRLDKVREIAGLKPLTV